MDRVLYGNVTQFVDLYREYLAGFFDKVYCFEWAGKTVLDIGGHVGDSSLFFLENGAKRIIIYEPVELNIKSLLLNLEKFRDRYEIIQKAVSERDEPITLLSSMPEGCACFGCRKGNYQIKCDGISFHTILKRHFPIDVAKVDCEGGEEYLCGVRNDLLSTVPYWIVESHSKEIKEGIQKKFFDAGFKMIKEFVINSDVCVSHFSVDSNTKV